MAINMSGQKEILNNAYDAMTPWAQEKLCKMALDLARTWPAKKKRGLLTLVKNSSPANVLRGVGDREVDQLPVVGCRKAVDR